MAQNFINNVNGAIISSMPKGFDIIEAGDTKDGLWGCIEIYNGNFPDDVTSIIMVNTDGTDLGVNLSSLNGSWLSKDEKLGWFKHIAIPEGSLMKIVAYWY